jgi:tetratricopeptide (TPR) repeat protein
MKAKLTALLISFVLTVFSIQAANAKFNKNPGTRAMGMGNAFTAVADDTSAMYWNPAGLDQIGDMKFHFLHDDLSLDRRFNEISMVFPKVLGGTIGFNYEKFEVNGIKEYVNTNGTDQLVGFFDETETAFKLSYGNQITKWVALGLTMKYLDQGLKNFSASGFGMDAGMLFTIQERLSFGLTIRDLGSSLDWDGTLTAPVEDLPTTFSAGIAYKPRDFITFAMDVEKNEDMDARTKFGVEFWFKDAVGIRAGTDNGELNVGASLILDDWQVDYAYETTELGDVNRIAATVNLETIREAMRSTYKKSREQRVAQRREERDDRRLSREAQKLSDKEQIIYEESEALSRSGINEPVVFDTSGYDIEESIPYDRDHDKKTVVYADENISGRRQTGQEEIIDLTMQAAENYFNKGSQALKDNDYYSAVNFFNKSIEINPYYAEAYRNLGVIYQRQKMYDQALRAYEQAVYIKPDSEYVYISLGDIYERKGMIEKAVEQYEKVISLVPGTRTAAIAARMIEHLSNKK